VTSQLPQNASRSASTAICDPKARTPTQTDKHCDTIRVSTSVNTASQKKTTKKSQAAILWELPKSNQKTTINKVCTLRKSMGRMTIFAALAVLQCLHGAAATCPSLAASEVVRFVCIAPEILNLRTYRLTLRQTARKLQVP
jgi:hypothetical protein